MKTFIPRVLSVIQEVFFWLLEKALRLGFFIVLFWIIQYFNTTENYTSPLLIEATVADLATTLIIPVIVVILFWSLMNDNDKDES